MPSVTFAPRHVRLAFCSHKVDASLGCISPSGRPSRRLSTDYLFSTSKDRAPPFLSSLRRRTALLHPSPRPPFGGFWVGLNMPIAVSQSARALLSSSLRIPNPPLARIHPYPHSPYGGIRFQSGPTSAEEPITRMTRPHSFGERFSSHRWSCARLNPISRLPIYWRSACMHTAAVLRTMSRCNSTQHLEQE